MLEPTNREAKGLSFWCFKYVVPLLVVTRVIFLFGSACLNEMFFWKNFMQDKKPACHGNFLVGRLKGWASLFDGFLWHFELDYA